MSKPRIPCPFCGSWHSDRQESAPTRRADVHYWVECKDCGARGPRTRQRHEMDKLWNARRDADRVHRDVPAKT